MCTAVVSIDLSSPVPVLLCGVRDEFLQRPWQPPAQHWPDRPGIWGGRDIRAGGTWLAVDPAARQAAALLNAFGVHAPEEGRLSRGGLPLAFAPPPPDDLPLYDPFHLVVASLAGVRMWTWDGVSLSSRDLGPGLHIVANTGLEGAGPHEGAPPRAIEDIAARLAHFRPRLLEARRPAPLGGPVEDAWGSWLPLLTGGELSPDDPAALVVRRDFGESGVWGTNSISLVGLGRDSVRYDFAAVPSLTWQRILPASPAPPASR
jgi:Transport and Golgi organisation 2